MPDVGCAGILVEDTFCGPMPSLPTEGSLLALNDMVVKAGGCAANVAIDLAKQGVSVDVVGCVGRDSAADFLLKTYQANGVGHSKVVRVNEHGTSRCIILLVKGEDRRYLYVDGANKTFSASHISRDWLAQLKVFYLGGLFVLPGMDPDGLAGLLEYCRSRGVLTVVDVVVPQEMRGMSELKQLLPLIDVFVPNEDEARLFTGLTDPMDQLRAFEAAGARTVIVTCGGRGSVALNSGKRWRCGVYQMEVVDPSGSGDAFTSGVIRGMLAGWNFRRTLCYASAIGASVTRAPGTTDTVFSASEAEEFVASHPMTVMEEA
jgi:sugar/nucleoside kinase (ribokinase family)